MMSWFNDYFAPQIPDAYYPDPYEEECDYGYALKYSDKEEEECMDQDWWSDDE